MKDGFLSVAAAAPQLHIADCAANAAEAVSCAMAAERKGVKLLVFPELFLTAYSCGDLFLSQLLLESAQQALQSYLEKTASLDLLTVIGLPVKHDGRLYNCAALCSHGTLLGLVPKTAIPDYGEFSEGRYFASAPSENETHFWDGREVPFGTKLLFACAELPELRVAVEICEDLWTPIPPSTLAAAASATVLCNLSASSEAIGKAAYRRMLVCSQAARTQSGYVYASSGAGESSTDVVFSGHAMVAECGTLLSERQPLSGDGNLFVISEIDLERISFERYRTHSFSTVRTTGWKVIPFSLAVRETTLSRPIAAYPFVPHDTDELARRCETVIGIQARGLAQRMTAARAHCCVIGVSGGLDSCLALLAAVHAMDLLGRPRTDVLGVTMPCFGTTGRTRSNAECLCRALHVSFREIDIADAVTTHFGDLKHDIVEQDTVYENAQARERTQVLMDLANAMQGIVVGTGDLSELALGFATYNGDHMSMYAINASVPKTLVRQMVAHFARTAEKKGENALGSVLHDILETPVSPELLPPDETGAITQLTETLVGPYALHDFYLYYIVRFGYTPEKVYRLACIAFAETDREEIRHWLRFFVSRFFSQQFKRSCLPDGPKVGTVSLSPRGDWRMPSDACVAGWLAQIDRLEG